VPIDATLNRARAELAAGNVAAARNRMRGLVGSFPCVIAAREVLAETYRRSGDLAQAGRWAYATETLTDEEAAAFTHAYRNDPVLMMRALRWSDSDNAAPVSPTVSHRLEQLKARAEEQAGREVSWDEPRYPPYKGSWLAALGGWSLVGFLVLVLVVGIVTIVRTVLGWIF
jgi:hypothetical protein